MTQVVRDWVIAAPFIQSADDRWLANFVPPEFGLNFTSVPGAYHHDRSRPSTDLAGWADYIRHGSAAWRAARRTGNGGVLTLFPQLPLAVGMLKLLVSDTTPLVAWTFNLGQLYGGLKRHIARAALSRVDLFVVHSTAEARAYSDWLDLPRDRFRFVPLQRPLPSIEDLGEPTSEPPYLLSMGSAHRDYRLLFDVVAQLGYPTIVVAGPHAVSGLRVPPNVQVRSGLSEADCEALLRHARLNVIPVDNLDTASGQVTLLDAMRFGRPVVVTACPASEDYVTHGQDAWMVRHGDGDDLRSALQRLWEDATLRTQLGARARQTVEQRFSDPAIGRRLGEVLLEVGR